MNSFMKKVTAAAVCAVQVVSAVSFGTTASAAAQETSPDTIAAGTNHTLVIRNNNTLWAAGDNSYGQLGVADIDSSAGVKVLSDVTYTEANDNVSFAIDSKGTLYGWGDNGSGQISAGTTSYMVNKPLKLMDNVAAVSAGMDHTVALTNDGTAYGWGSNTYGQLGMAENNSKNGATVIMKDVADIAAGDGFTLLVTKSGELYGCGLNNNGQLGLSNFKNQDTPAKSLSGVSRVEAGAAHTVALKTDGSVWTTGLNDCGQLGQRYADTTEYTFDNVPLDNVAYVFAGGNSSGALTTSGRLYTWGDNAYGQLHNSSSDNESTPDDVASGVVSIAFGDHHSAMLKSNGTLSTVGMGVYGELFSSIASSCVTPQLAVKDVISYSAGTDHAAAVTSSGALYTWGNNDCGQLGLGDTSQRVKPTKVGLKSDAVKVWCGNKITFVLTSDNTVYVFGSNKDMLLGMKTKTNVVKTPTVNTGLSDYADIEIYPSDGFCLALAGGEIYGWGRNSASRMLDCPSKVTDPMLIYDKFGSGFTKLAVGNNHVLALDNSGAVYVWGANSSGQLGLNYSVNTISEPEKLEIYNRKDELQADSFSDIAAASNHSMVLDTDGQVWVFGNNSNGQLGTSSGRIKTPTSVAKNISYIFAGQTACGVIDNDDKLLMSGKNSFGALGDGTVRDKSKFSDVTGKDIEYVSIGSGFAGYINGYDDLYCWGDNSMGQAGIGSGGNDVKPSAVMKDAAVITTIQADSVALNKTELTLKPSQSEKLTATVKPSGANAHVTWTSSNTSVATVSADGTVKGVANGTAVITVKTVNGKTATCSVSVSVPVTSFSVTPSKSKTVTVGKSFKLKTKVYPSTASDKTLLYSSSDEDVLVVDENGTVTTLSSGKAVITITAKSNPAKTRKVTITVRPAKVVITSRKSTKTGIILKWNDAEGADGYEVFRKLSGSNKKAVSIGDTGDDTAFTDETAVKGKAYIYTVKAYTIVNGKKIYSVASKRYKITAK